jgi:hypothetical protein
VIIRCRIWHRWRAAPLLFSPGDCLLVPHPSSSSLVSPGRAIQDQGEVAGNHAADTDLSHVLSAPGFIPAAGEPALFGSLPPGESLLKEPQRLPGGHPVRCRLGSAA